MLQPEIVRKESQKTIVIGVIADTHVPDRVGSLHPDVLPSFKKKPVDYIIHAGDISSKQVIDQLSEIAPVRFAKGNRDWFLGNSYPPVVYLEANKVRIAITHGHGTWMQYLLDKFPYLILGYRFKRYHRKLEEIVDDAKIVVFGHTHHRENRWVKDRLFFNPGSAYDRGMDKFGPSIGFITISPNQEVQGEIVRLGNAKWVSGGWVI